MAYYGFATKDGLPGPSLIPATVVVMSFPWWLPNLLKGISAMWFVNLIVGLSTPLMVVGIIGAIVAFIYMLRSVYVRSENHVGSADWLISNDHAKIALKTAIGFALVAGIGFAMPSQDGSPQIRTTVQYKYPKYKELFDECRGGYNDADTIKKCQDSASSQMDQIKKYNPEQVTNTVYLVPRLPDLYKECQSSWNGKDASWKNVNEFNAQCEDIVERQYKTMVNQYKEKH